MVDLSGWSLTAEDGSPSISLSGTLESNAYYLLERMDDSTVSDVAADMLYSGALENEGEALYLYNDSGVLIDFVGASSDWPTGSTEYSRSMERINPTEASVNTNWANNNLISHNGLDANSGYVNGTPGQENSVSRSFTTLSDLRLIELNEVTLGVLGSPYKTTNTLLLVPQSKTLNIDPGVTIEFFTSISGSNAGLEITGTLRAVGTQENKIIFTAQSSPFFWKGIHFVSNATDTASEISWATIEYAKGGSSPLSSLSANEHDFSLKNSTLQHYKCDNCRGLMLADSDASVENTEFLGGYPDYATYGIHIENGNPTIQSSIFQENFSGIFVNLLNVGDLPTISDNTFTQNRRAVDTRYPNIVFQNNTGSLNTEINGILFQNGVLNQNLTWFQNDLPYVISSSLTVSSGNTLTVQPGVTNLMQSNASFTVYGTLNAQGTETDRITFTSFNDCSDTPCPGFWGSLSFVSPSTASALKYVDIEYGGKTTGNIYAKDVAVDIDHVTSSYAKEAALYLENSLSSIQNSDLENSVFGMKLYGTSYPTLGPAVSFQNNSVKDVFIDNTGECTDVLGSYAENANTNCP